MAADVLRITLRLRTIEHLFTDPDLSPFDPYYAPTSFAAGMDYVVGEMQRSPRTRRTELTVLLPPHQIEPDLQQRTRVAIGRYAEAWATSERQQLAVEFQRAWQVTFLAVAFFAVANLITIAYNRQGEILGASGIALDVMTEGLGVAAWVALWWPLDQLMHALWQRRLDSRAYEELNTVAVRILPDPDAPPAEG
jgi:hypothetical protein